MRLIRILGILVLAVMLVASGSTKNQADDDADFLDWLRAYSEFEQRLYDEVANAIVNQEWRTVEAAAKAAADYVSNTSILECDSLIISKEYDAVR